MGFAFNISVVLDWAVVLVPPPVLKHGPRSLSGQQVMKTLNFHWRKGIDSIRVLIRLLTRKNYAADSSLGCFGAGYSRPERWWSMLRQDEATGNHGGSP